MNDRQSKVPDTHKESDLPAFYSAHLESDVLGLAIGQSHTAADLVVTDGKHNPTAGFWVVAGTGVQLNVAVVPDLLGQLQKLSHGGVEKKGETTHPQLQSSQGDAAAGETHRVGSRQSALFLEHTNGALSPASFPTLTPDPAPAWYLEPTYSGMNEDWS